MMIRIWNGYKIIKNNSNSYSVKLEMEEERSKTYPSLKKALAEAEKHPTGPYTGPKLQKETQ